jgi:hypothetical protein
MYVTVLAVLDTTSPTWPENTIASPGCGLPAAPSGAAQHVDDGTDQKPAPDHDGAAGHPDPRDRDDDGGR